MHTSRACRTQRTPFSNPSMKGTNTRWLYSADFSVVRLVALRIVIVEYPFLRRLPGPPDWLQANCCPDSIRNRLIGFTGETGRTISTLHDPLSGTWTPGKGYIGNNRCRPPFYIILLRRPTTFLLSFADRVHMYLSRSNDRRRAFRERFAKLHRRPQPMCPENRLHRREKNARTTGGIYVRAASDAVNTGRRLRLRLRLKEAD